ncbi:MAG: putative sugar nucleotidyl transferase [candidate division Zixibacteria bacterium]
MANKLIIFEDNNYVNFHPLTLNRPVFTLRCGAFELWEKIAKNFVDYTLAYSCREEIAPSLRQEANSEVNTIDYQGGDKLVFINGRLRLGPKLVNEIKTCTENRIFLHDKTTAAVVICEDFPNSDSQDINFTGDSESQLMGVKADLIQGEFEFYNYLWDLVNLNGNEISADYTAYFSDFDLSKMIDSASIDSSARILSQDNLYIAANAEIGANCVIDNRKGPVIIDENAVIGPLSFIEGPCYIGRETQVFRSHIREGCSFGPVCRVGGEVEDSIFQGYTNKYHDGFMGHAYLGSWVNLGAMTTNSDLKNNYKDISVTLNGQNVNTGCMKIGCFIGDHTKTGIDTLINTGVSIGFSCNIYGGTLVTSSEVPSFSWGDESGYDIYKLDKAIEVARASMARRNIKMNSPVENIFSHIFENRLGNL